MATKRKVFIDADAFIALNSPNHKLYFHAVKAAEKIKNDKLAAYTATYTLLEVATVLNRLHGRRVGSTYARSVIDNSMVTIVEGDHYLEKGIGFMDQQSSKKISLNDCVYFAIAEDLKIDLIFSFDKHWVKNGFTLI